MDTPELQTKRLILRKIQPKDTEEIFQCWMQDEDVSRYMYWKASNDRKDAEEFVEFELGNLENDKWNRWIIILKETAQIIGTCLIYYNDEEDNWDISYNLGKRFWGKGYSFEAMSMVMQYARKKLQIKECIAIHAIENPASGRVIQKLGFVYEKDVPYECNGGEIITTGKYYRYKVKKLSEMTLEELWHLFPITLTEHDRNWMKDYHDMEYTLKNILDGFQNIRISHIGSTSINGIWAKPIVDILIEIEKDADMDAAAERLTDNGFILMSRSADRISLNRGYTQEGFADKVYHLHLRYLGDHDELYFRDYLNEYPGVAKDYEQLKLKLWKQYEFDRDEYTEAKAEFVKKYTDEAKKRYRDRYQ